MKARSARRADAAAIAAIYNQGIEDRVATFETRMRSEDDILAWFASPYPVVVVEDDESDGDDERDGHGGEIVAFGSTSAYSSRECYAGVAECSVYVKRDTRGRGVGRMALQELLRVAEAAGFWKLTSRVFVENAASRKLIRSLGFREVGVHEKHARLDGTWRDVIVVERLIERNCT